MAEHAKGAADLDKALGIFGVVFGALVLLGEFSLWWVVPAFGLVLIVLGVALIGGLLRGSGALGIVLVVLGGLLLSGLLGLDGAAGRALHIAVGAALLVIGIVKLA